MANRKPILCVVSPCYNEAEVIGLFYDELKAVLVGLADEVDHRIVFVDDGSRDATLEVLNRMADRDPRVMAYSFSRNFGHQAAVSAGIEVARGDAVVVMDSDLQHPPALIPEMVRLWREGHDVVSAIREKTEGASFLKNVTSGGFYTIINWLSETRIEPGAADFCLLSRRARRVIAQMPERHRFVRGLVSWIGFNRATVPYKAAERAAGHSKYSLSKMLRLALDAVFSFSVTPIHMATRMGLTVAGLGCCYLAYVLGRAVVLHDLTQGWGSLISVVLVLGGLQLVFIGMIGEYLGRVFEQVKGRPIYLFKQRPSKARWTMATTAGERTGAL